MISIYRISQQLEKLLTSFEEKLVAFSIIFTNSS